MKGHLGSAVCQRFPRDIKCQAPPSVGVLMVLAHQDLFHTFQARDQVNKHRLLECCVYLSLETTFVLFMETADSKEFQCIIDMWKKDETQNKQV